jgi:soluble lytic murein transglycosylase-like protein
MVKNWLKKALISAVLLSTLVVTPAYAPYDSKEKLKQPLVTYVVSANPNISEKSAREIVVAAQKWGYEFGLDSKLILAIVKVESNFHPHAISTSGAYGLMQVIPTWHKEKIVKAKKELGNPEIFNINTNIYLGSMVLKECLLRSSNKTSKALLCYSGQTKGYDDKVLKHYVLLKTAVKIPT